MSPVGPTAVEPSRGGRDFGLLWGGAGLAMLGGRATAFAYPLVVLWATDSSGAAGLVGFALLLPHLLVQLPGGALVDRVDRRRLMTACGLGSALVAAGAAAALLSGAVWLPHLLVSAFLEGVFTVLYQLAERSAVPALVPPDRLAVALTRNEARTRAASVLGQPAGSALAGLGAGFPFVFALVTHLGSVVFLTRIRGPLRSPADGAAPAVPASPRALAREVGEGLAWLWGQPFLRSVMVAVAVSNVLFQGLNLAVMAAVKDAGGAVATVGAITAMSGVGGLVGSLCGAWWMRRYGMRALVVGGLAAWTALMLPVAGTRDAVALGALFAGSGYVGGVFNVVVGVHLTRAAPEQLRGRANSVAMLVSSGAMAMGPPAAGFLLAAVGPARTILALGAAMGVTSAATALSRALRIEEPTPAQPKGVEAGSGS